MDLNMQMKVLGEILLAILLGGIIGYEREEAGRPAGLRTHMLVAGSAALLVSVSRAVVDSYSNNIPENLVAADPIRIIQAIIVGISFLGAGTIFQRRQGEPVQGLTTAASILFTSGIGIAVSLGLFALAVGGTMIVLVVMHIFGRIELQLFGKENSEENSRK